MKEFFLNLTRIVEANSRVYFAIIAAIVLSLVLFIAEAVHIQTVANALQTHDQVRLKEVIQPLTTRYGWSRAFIIGVMVLWSIWEYRKTKQRLGL
ncbi:hypothetical protein D7V64_09405 [Acinetobacter cumulans]|jgi:hypothetical protein|uniref:Uncharacterized protein n=1 Tax=Acinetobacter cumulans TaxID=2136182 RepID=A0A3A8G043_9GAMM|nr:MULTISPECIES: hypothetical protein [Acinetobacter]NWK75500.1 hypothetical protein [Acinetobacter sp. SwsAc6]QCO21274.1 hypothetical protein C9E88_006970 [Acinetobacter cumulans]RFS28051.1 hypothetical protein DYI81_14015 [Acinetobacter sp. SWAC5]RKG44572.1 hypothetical protein D7V51_07390 [Acinetobacter cumulans]RKG51774.1 hypothetical protein D7V68_00205 [Acinetobacter cumulans]